MQKQGLGQECLTTRTGARRKLPEIEHGNGPRWWKRGGKGGRVEATVMVRILPIWGHCFYWVLSFNPYISHGNC